MKVYWEFEFDLNYIKWKFTLHSPAFDLGCVTVYSRVRKTKVFDGTSLVTHRIECKTQALVGIL